MKTKIGLGILVLILSWAMLGTIQAQEQTVKDNVELVTDSNVEKLVDKYSTKVTVAIQGLAKSLQQPAEHVYKILIRQQLLLALFFPYLVEVS